MKSASIFLVVLIFLSLSVYAQNESTRLEKQHHIRYIKSHLIQIQENILKSFENKNAGVAESNIITLRQLEQIFPEEKFSSFITPLAKIVQDEQADTQTRLLSVLALDLLHSDLGDKSIYYTAKYTDNKSVKDLCNCLSIEGRKMEVADRSYH